MSQISGESARFIFASKYIRGYEIIATTSGNNFEMKRRTKIRRQGFVGKLSNNNLAKFQPNWSRGCRLGVQNTCTTHPNFYIEKQGKIEF